MVVVSYYAPAVTVHSLEARDEQVEQQDIGDHDVDAKHDGNGVVPEVWNDGPFITEASVCGIPRLAINVPYHSTFWEHITCEYTHRYFFSPTPTSRNAYQLGISNLSIYV